MRLWPAGHGTPLSCPEGGMARWGQKHPLPQVNFPHSLGAKEGPWLVSFGFSVKEQGQKKAMKGLFWPTAVDREGSVGAICLTAQHPPQGSDARSELLRSWWQLGSCQRSEEVRLPFSRGLGTKGHL